MHDFDEIKETFAEEAGELLADMEEALLALEDSPGDRELINRVFRAIHTIKGSGGMVGLCEISVFAHEIETVLDLAREGIVKITHELISLSLSAKDHIRGMIEARRRGQEIDDIEGERITALFRGFLHPGREEQRTAGTQKDTLEVCGALVTYRIRFKPSREISFRGVNPAAIVEGLRALGDCTIIAHAEDIPPLGEINPEHCYTYWDVILSTSKGIDAIRDEFMFVEQESELVIELIDDEGRLNDEESYKRLGEILVEKGALRREDLEDVLRKKKLTGLMLVESGCVSPEEVHSALAEQQHVRENRDRRKTAESMASMRVSAEKLDSLVNIVGQLVTVQARLSQFADQWNNKELIGLTEDVERLTSELREKTMSVRMVPIGNLFGKFRRVIRDLARELNKEIEFITEGGDTELDKTLIEKLNDPLVHLIRNCVDHGIELPEQRESAGKERKGTVCLSAEHSGAHVVISIRDDGAGVDVERLRAKAVGKGLIRHDDVLSEREILQLIFLPGMSTVNEITDISGRGVGMDVVKRTIDDLRGTIEIANTDGRGLLIRMKLPLTLAIIEGFLVRIGEDFFVIPLSMVSECMELTPKLRKEAHGRKIVNVRGAIVPYVRLREYFRINGSSVPEVEHLVIVESGDRRTGLLADKIIGAHQTVIKNLGGLYRNIDGVSGATILGNGKVALILDVPVIVEQMERLEASALVS